jgi:hypothetical protein
VAFSVPEVRLAGADSHLGGIIAFRRRVVYRLVICATPAEPLNKVATVINSLSSNNLSEQQLYDYGIYRVSKGVSAGDRAVRWVITHRAVDIGSPGGG